jgi:hypothetical protein
MPHLRQIRTAVAPSQSAILSSRRIVDSILRTETRSLAAASGISLARSLRRLPSFVAAIVPAFELVCPPYSSTT